MANKKQTKEIKLPKVELKEGNIRITGDKLVLGLNVDKDIDKSKDRSNVSIENPVIDIATDEQFREDLMAIIMVLVDVTSAKQGGMAGPKAITKAIKDYKKAYKDFKKEEAEEK
ncbi:MAG: hypothetical protein A7315_08160 [Candidatus Altiarchaeales archaeon WOR_SM1_79]|nr:MAG: hypothetical protein A7315_08160 [Candidatus Altiarchaeales archaeon WOR_SM1_79]